ERGRAHFGRWCNGTLPAQEGRRGALQRLLGQAQVSSTDGLRQLEQEKAALGDSLERLRVAAEAAQSAQHEQLATALLDQEDSSADVRALQRAAARLSKERSPANAGPVKVLKQLEAEAEGSERRHAKQAQLLQTSASGGASAREVSRLEGEYRGKTARIEEVQHLFYTTQRSLAILTNAIEDESAYLADVQSVCDVERVVYQRIQGTAVPALRGALAGLASGTSTP
ncbi:unnamed protein product, partial [Prorocentrum cordatum]